MNPQAFERARTAIALVFVFSMTTAQSTTYSSRAATLAAPCIPYDLYSKYPGRYPGRVSCPPPGRGSTSDGSVTGATSGGPTTDGGDRPDGGTSDGGGNDGGDRPEGTREPPRHHGGGGGGWGPLVAALGATIVAGTAIEADHGKVDFEKSQRAGRRRAEVSKPTHCRWFPDPWLRRGRLAFRGRYPDAARHLHLARIALRA